MTQAHLGAVARVPNNPALVVGGDFAVQLAWCRLLGPARRVSLLRWEPQPSGAVRSRYCYGSHWIGKVDEGVGRWKERLAQLLRTSEVRTLIPADPLAHLLLCDGSFEVPDQVAILGPSKHAYGLGSDRLRAFDTARACGWHVPDRIHVATPGVASEFSVPCVVRPRHDVRIAADEPVRFSIKRVANADALEAKLRDDVPRGEVVLQPALTSTRRLCAAARGGALIGMWTPGDVHDAASPLADATRQLVAALSWDGVLELEYGWSDGTPLLIDIQVGSGSAFVEAVRSREPLGMALVPAARGLDPLAPIAESLLGVATLTQKARLRLRAAMWHPAGGSGDTPRLLAASQILLVCKGNINRSVVAEHVLRAAGYSTVTSAALLGLTGRRPSRAAECFIRDVLRIPAEHVRSQSVRHALERSRHIDLVLCFERREAVELSDRYPELRARIHLLPALDPEQRLKEIGDPHGRSESDYRHCFDQVRDVLQRAISHSSEVTDRTHAARG